MKVRRYWFEFARPSDGVQPMGTQMGCGVTAYDYEDSLTLLRERVFRGVLPAIVKVIEDVDVSTLDRGHVIPNMGSPATRGIWFPLGYDGDGRPGGTPDS